MRRDDGFAHRLPADPDDCHGRGEGKPRDRQRHLHASRIQRQHRVVLRELREGRGRRLRDPDREKEFLAGAQERDMDGLKGHRSVGGFRASLYNAFPLAGAHALAEYLGAFAGQGH